MAAHSELFQEGKVEPYAFSFPLDVYVPPDNNNYLY